MNLLIDSVFTPLTYSDFMAPVKDYMEVYNDREAKYEDLVQNTFTWEDEVKQGGKNNEKARQLYNSFAPMLRVAADDFSNGLNVTNRGDYLKLKRGYNEKIVPLEKADAKRKELNSLREQALANDRSLIYAEYDLEDPGLDPFLGGGTVSNEAYSGDKLEQETASMFQKAAYSLFNDMTTASIGKGQYFNFQTLKGVPADKLLTLLNQGIDALEFDGLEPEKVKELREKYQKLDGILQSQKDMFSHYGEKAKARAYKYIERGAYAGMQESIDNIQQDRSIEHYLTQRGQDLDYKKAMAQIAAQKEIARDEIKSREKIAGMTAASKSGNTTGTGRGTVLPSPVLINVSTNRKKSGQVQTLTVEEANKLISKGGYKSKQYRDLDTHYNKDTKDPSKTSNTFGSYIRDLLNGTGTEYEHNYYQSGDGDWIMVWPMDNRITADPQYDFSGYEDWILPNGLNY